MAISIITNTASLNAQVNLNKSQNAMSQAIERLSTGLRINSAKDDAAGFAISEQLTAQTRGYSQAARNANDALSLANTAGSNLDSITGALQRIRELAVQASNDTYSADGRAKMNEESSALVAEIQRIATQANFNGVKLLDGSFTSKQFQVGADNGQLITMSDIESVKTDSLGITYVASLTAGTQNTTARTALDGSNLTINGVDVVAAVAGENGRNSTSAYAIANAINSSGIEGVTASADATTVTSGAVGSTTANITAGGITINDVAIGAITGQTTDALQRSAVMAAINLLSNEHGVVATAGAGTAIVLTASDGRDIKIDTLSGNATLANTGLTGNVTNQGSVDLSFRSGDSSDSLSLSTTAASVAAVMGAGYGTGTTQTALSSQDTYGINGLSLTNLANAQKAIIQIDAALDQITTVQAQLGSFQNRMDFVIDNAESAVENNEAANSQIKDADFAAETANMTKANIMVQAGTAVLAQANAMKQSVLQLLG